LIKPPWAYPGGFCGISTRTTTKMLAFYAEESVKAELYSNTAQIRLPAWNTIFGIGRKIIVGDVAQESMYVTKLVTIIY
jgi:hypothetical protein